MENFEPIQVCTRSSTVLFDFCLDPLVDWTHMAYIVDIEQVLLEDSQQSTSLKIQCPLCTCIRIEWCVSLCLSVKILLDSHTGSPDNLQFDLRFPIIGV